MLKKKLISLLNEAKSETNKSEIRIIEILEKTIRISEKIPDDLGSNKVLIILFLLVIHDVLRYLPCVEAIIRSIYLS